MEDKRKATQKSLSSLLEILKSGTFPLNVPLVVFDQDIERFRSIETRILSITLESLFTEDQLDQVSRTLASDEATLCSFSQNVLIKSVPFFKEKLNVTDEYDDANINRIATLISIIKNNPYTIVNPLTGQAAHEYSDERAIFIVLWMSDFVPMKDRQLGNPLTWFTLPDPDTLRQNPLFHRFLLKYWNHPSFHPTKTQRESANFIKTRLQTDNNKGGWLILIRLSATSPCLITVDMAAPEPLKVSSVRVFIRREDSTFILTDHLKSVIRNLFPVNQNAESLRESPSTYGLSLEHFLNEVCVRIYNESKKMPERVDYSVVG